MRKVVRGLLAAAAGASAGTAPRRAVGDRATGCATHPVPHVLMCSGTPLLVRVLPSIHMRRSAQTVANQHVERRNDSTGIEELV